MTDWITITLGVYSIILTTIIVVDKLNQNLKKIKVSVNTSLLGLPGAFINALSISFTNSGKRQIQIDGCGFKLPDKKILTVLNPVRPFSFPVLLQEGSGYSVHGNITDLVSAIRDAGYLDTIKIQGFVRDASGKKYFSKKLKFDINRWIN